MGGEELMAISTEGINGREQGTKRENRREMGGNVDPFYVELDSVIHGPNLFLLLFLQISLFDSL